MPTWLVPLLPLLGVVVGAATQYVLSRTQEAERQRRTLRTTAYVDYLRGVTATALAQRHGDHAEEVKAAVLMADAKARMCVYGGSATLRALSDLHQRGASLATAEGAEAFLALCETMRAETGDAPITRTELAQVLFEGGVPRLPAPRGKG